VAAVLVRDGRVLVAERGPTMPIAGAWEFPGGKVEAGEDDGEALVREIREELEVEVEVGRRIGESRHHDGRRWLHLVAYRCDLLHGEPRAHLHTRVEWSRPEDLDGYGFAPADVPLLDAVRAECRAAG
jgi:mutator protein MutT